MQLEPDLVCEGMLDTERDNTPFGFEPPIFLCFDLDAIPQRLCADRSDASVRIIVKDGWNL